MSTMKDVAKACGVSTATVSRAFTRDAVIAEATRTQILETARAMGCRPNVLARGLRRSRSQMVGMIVPTSDNDFFLRQMREIETALRTKGYRLLVCFLQEGVTSEADALDVMEASPIDALIFTPENRQSEERLSRLRSKIRLLQLDRRIYPDLTSVDIDNVAATKKAALRLIADGHRRIFFIGGGHRVKGYYEALEENGIVPDPSLISLDWNVGEERIEAMLRESDATAAIAVAKPAEVFWRTLTHLKIGVPDRLSLIVFDDMKWVSMFDITSVSHPYGEIARLCVERLLSMVEDGGEDGARETVTPFIVERSSVKKIDIRN